MRAPSYGGHGSLSVRFLLLAALATAAAACSAGTASTQEQTDRGQALYAENCATCHGGATGGSLKDTPPPHNANGHTWHHPNQQLEEMILEGITFSLEEQKMPAFKDKLSATDVEVILAYIKTWWTPEQQSFQATVTAQWNSR
ncbi:MAG: cytochrome c [Chloroflexi bacterium]|nr:cytochrome c [Chloroflexota bacterium]